MASIEAYESKAGTRYVVRYRTPERRLTMKRGFTRKRDAQAFAEDVENAKRIGTFIPESAGRVTVGDLARDWLGRRAGVVRPKTYAQDQSLIRTHVTPRWGSVPVGRVRRTAVQAWVSGLAASGASASTVRQAVGALRKILADAVDDRLIPSNPAADIKLPKSAGVPRVYLDPDQLTRLAAASGTLAPVVLTLGWTGLRFGELAALRVADVDLRARRLHIHATASEVHGQIVEGDPKTAAGTRRVPYPAFLGPLLEARVGGRGPDDYLFTMPDGGQLRSGNVRSRYLTPAWEAVGSAVSTAQEALSVPATGVLDLATLEAAQALRMRHCVDGEAGVDRATWRLLGIPDGSPLLDVTLNAGARDFRRPTLHDLRHTAASLAISSGANVKAVQTMLGHTSAAMTLDVYADLFPDDLDAVGVALDRLGTAAATEIVLKLCSP